MRRSLALAGRLALAALLLSAKTASAQPAPGPVAPPPVAPVMSAPPPVMSAPPPVMPPPVMPMADPGLAMWEAQYLDARRARAEGRFDEAMRRFGMIAVQAPDPSMRAHAAELGSLARYWLGQGLVLGPVSTFDQWARAAQPEKERPDQRSTDEIAVLYTNTALWGMGFGLTVGVATEGSAAAFFLPGLGMVGAGATTVALLDNVGSTKLRYGVPQSITAGMYMGFEGGMFAALTANAAQRGGVSGGAMAGIMWGSATAGAITFGLVGHYGATTPGRASFTESGAIWGGMLTSFLTAGVTTEMSGRGAETAPWVGGLIGTGAGAVAAGIFADGMAPSIARVRFIDLGGLVGGLTFGGVYASLASTTGDKDINARAFFFVASAGIASGLGVTYYLTRKIEPDPLRRRKNEVPEGFASITPRLVPLPGGASAGLSGVF
ncbi:MAG: hypothetical protein U0359_29410 [Byssovorax sp.]